jgi:tetratricopeptide (TPR) repeat protein
MAYVRQRGNQLAIVHGIRDPETKKVEQRILFTLYSKAEALEALGQGEKGGAFRFRSLLESSHATIRFDWKKILRTIEENLNVLPETYDYRSTRLQRGFREDLLSFARQLMLADPQMLTASSQLVSEHRKELEYLRELIDWRLEAPEDSETQWTADNAFYWRFATRDIGVPPDIEEHAAELYEKREYERAAVAFKVLTGAFEDYAQGHNYLGLIALDQEHLDEAIAHFKKTMEVGRRLFPKRIAKTSWWSDHRTRPYMRGLRNLALTLTQTKRYQEALAVCDRLVEECHDDITAAAHRATAYLNTGRWQQALDAATYIHQISPSESIIASFAAFALGKHQEARTLFLHAALNCPRAVGMLMGARFSRPKDNQEVDDHNTGVSLLRTLADYLQKRPPGARRFYSQLWKDKLVTSYRKELEEVERRWREDRNGQDRTAYDRMMRLRSWDFARTTTGPVDPQAPVGALSVGSPSLRVIH